MIHEIRVLVLALVILVCVSVPACAFALVTWWALTGKVLFGTPLDATRVYALFVVSTISLTLLTLLLSCLRPSK